MEEQVEAELAAAKEAYRQAIARWARAGRA
jgi:hypothetical protein